MQNNSLNMPSRDHAGVYIPPPMIYVATFFLSVGMQRAISLPTAWLDTQAVHGARWLLMGGAFIFLIPALWRFAASRNSLITIKPARSLQTTGIYAITRNPMYLGLLLLYSAMALFHGNCWTLLFIVPLLLVVEAYVIKKEESYLQREFGDVFLRYKSNVRRWI